MKNKTLVSILVALLIVIPTGLFAVFSAAKPIELPSYEPMFLGEDFRNSDLELDLLSLDLLSLESSLAPKSAGKPGGGGGEEPTVIEYKVWLSLDDYYGAYFFDLFELWDVGDGADAQVWVQSNLAWPEGDPRAEPIVTPSQVEYLLNEFETHIKPTDTGYFGDVDTHDGTYSLLEVWDYFEPGYFYDAAGRDVILVSNIEDENYYDPDYPYYIAGFYSPTFEGYFDRNIISMDCYNWEDRIGPDTDRPYLYEGLIAHEYQHLIHDDYFVDVSDATFMNEGCSMFAEVLCGYPIDWGAINSYLVTPDNSLNEWSDQGGINILADYGQVQLWATFINDFVDDQFLKEYVASGLTTALIETPGIDLLDELLGDYGWDFLSLFKEWRLANLMGTGYSLIDFSDREREDLRVYEVKDKWPDCQGTDFGNTITILDYDTGVSMLGSYGTDYILLSKLKWKYPSMLVFDGDDFATSPTWVMDGDAWYSTPAGPLANRLHAAPITVPTDGILRFDTMYDIEDDELDYPGYGWDFGFVQILPSGLDPLVDENWITLANEFTTDLYHPDAHSDIIAKLPGLTGFSDGWITLDFDISVWAGMDVLIGFRYMTDWGTENPGWWIENVELYADVDGDLTFDSYVEDFFTPSPEVEFYVTIIRQDFWDGKYYYSLITDLILDPATEEGSIDLGPYLESPGEDLRYPDVLLLVSSDIGPVDYRVSVIRQ